MQAHLDLSAEAHEEIPPASAIDTIATDPDVVEVARLLIRADVGSKAVRINVTLPQDLLQAVDRYAKSQGYTRSGLLAHAVRQRIGRQAGTSLAETRRAHPHQAALK